MTAYHKPSDFKIGTEFFGAVSFTHFKVIDIYRKAQKTQGRRKYPKKTLISYQNKKTKKIYTTDIDTLCRCKIEIIK